MPTTEHVERLRRRLLHSGWYSKPSIRSDHDVFPVQVDACLLQQGNESIDIRATLCWMQGEAEDDHLVIRCSACNKCRCHVDIEQARATLSVVDDGLDMCRIDAEGAEQ